MAEQNPYAFVLVSTLLPDLKKRHVDALCRAERFSGAVKVGRQWMIRPVDFAASVAARTADNGAAADLERAGFRCAS